MNLDVLIQILLLGKTPLAYLAFILFELEMDGNEVPFQVELRGENLIALETKQISFLATVEMVLKRSLKLIFDLVLKESFIFQIALKVVC